MQLSQYSHHNTGFTIKSSQYSYHNTVIAIQLSQYSYNNTVSAMELSQYSHHNTVIAITLTQYGNQETVITIGYKRNQSNKHQCRQCVYLLVPIFPNVLVRGTSGRMQALPLRCAGCLIQSSQYLNTAYHHYRKYKLRLSIGCCS